MPDAAGASPLWRVYDDALALLAGAAVTPSTFEALCLVEQAVADSAQATGQPFRPGLTSRLRQAAAAVACQLWADHRDAVDWTALRAALPTSVSLRDWLASRLRADAPGRRFHAEWAPKVPECLSTAPVDHGKYVTAVARWLRATPGRATRAAVVVGIRTSGSYLAPLWMAAYRREGLAATYRTIRPPSRYTVPTGPAPTGRDELPDLTGARVFLVDDGAATGRTLAAATAAVTAAGAEASDVTSVCYRPPARDFPGSRRVVVLRGTGTAVAEQPGAGQRHVAAGLDDLDCGLTAAAADVGPLRLGYWTGYLDCHLGAKPGDGATTRANLRKYRYLVRAHSPTAGEVLLVAKYLGYGCHARAEAAALGGLPASVPVVGTARGFLYLRYVAGTPARFRDGAAWSADDVRRMADCVAGLRRDAVLNLVPAGVMAQRARDDLAWLRGQGVAGLPPEHVVASPTGAAVPVVRAPRNHGFWHFLRAVDGSLLRLHRDVGHWERRIDPVEDLAAVVVEAGLGERSTAALLRAYTAALPGAEDITAARLVAGLLSHTRRVLGEFAARDVTVAAGRSAGDQWPGDPAAAAARAAYTERREFLTRRLGPVVEMLAAYGRP